MRTTDDYGQEWPDQEPQHDERLGPWSATEANGLAMTDDKLYSPSLYSNITDELDAKDENIVSTSNTTLVSLYRNTSTFDSSEAASKDTATQSHPSDPSSHWQSRQPAPPMPSWDHPGPAPFRGEEARFHHQTRVSLVTPPSPVRTEPKATDAKIKPKKSKRFWLIFASLMAVTCLTAVDMTIISTTLPTIVLDLPKSDIPASWVTSAFLLSTTAFQPFFGGLADVVGRRNALVGAVLFFLGGSIFAALANSMLLLVIGRGIQGVGGGGVQAVAEIIMSDLTTLRERGLYVGLISLVFAVASFIAPVLGGVFSAWNWRWVFWINLPIGVAALAMIIPSMKLHTPEMTLMAKIHRMDIIPNLVLLGSVIGLLVGITDGGVLHPWSSWRILGPLIGGGVGLVLFFCLELIPNPLAKDPVLPRRLFSNRTSATCFVMTFTHGVITYGLIYMLPIYFQSIKGASPLKSAIDMFPATAPGPIAAIIAGVAMALTGKYKIQIAFWWAVLCGGCGAIYMLDQNTKVWESVVYQLIGGFGVGALFSLTLPPIQASLPVEELAHATATFAFCRSFGSVWGIAMGTTIFISTVDSKLRAIPGLTEIGLTGSTSLGYATELQKLPVELQQPVKDAFMKSLKWSFLSYLPLAGLSFLICFFVKELPLPDFNESKHGLDENAPSPSKMAQDAKARIRQSIRQSFMMNRPSGVSKQDIRMSSMSFSTPHPPISWDEAEREKARSKASDDSRSFDDDPDDTFDHVQNATFENAIDDGHMWDPPDHDGGRQRMIMGDRKNYPERRNHPSRHEPEEHHGGHLRKRSTHISMDGVATNRRSSGRYGSAWHPSTSAVTLTEHPLPPPSHTRPLSTSRNSMVGYHAYGAAI